MPSRREASSCRRPAVCSLAMPRSFSSHSRLAACHLSQASPLQAVCQLLMRARKARKSSSASMACNSSTAEGGMAADWFQRCTAARYCCCAAWFLSPSSLTTRCRHARRFCAGVSARRWERGPSKAGAWAAAPNSASGQEPEASIGGKLMPQWPKNSSQLMVAWAAAPPGSCCGIGCRDEAPGRGADSVLTKLQCRMESAASSAPP
mmetsp:Transcript_59814/g.192524  ORF Transcript_59814/g.192524 Transcript_59814/m.192524 type:complete len:206 (-) Transcript_59814:15-632(-)